ncbi:MAG: AraC family transcriptional regulator [Fluviicola sp.]|nr:MAG: AraC family transcriptional regulator [Fluviicola sp.]
MEFKYRKDLEMSCFVLTDFSSENIQTYLKEENQYKIVWGRDSNVEVEVDGSIVEIKKNGLMFFTPENRLKIESSSCGAVLLSFNREFYCIQDHDLEVSCNGVLFYGSSLPVSVELNELLSKSVMVIIDVIIEEFKVEEQLQGEMLRTLLKQILITSIRLRQKIRPVQLLNNAQIETIREFNLLIEKHFRTKHKVKDYAELLNLPAKSLSNIFSGYSKLSPRKVISNRISVEAQRLIQFSDKNFKEIAYELGFADAAHFSRFFKKIFGVSPRGYKSNIDKF